MSHKNIHTTQSCSYKSVSEFLHLTWKTRKLAISLQQYNQNNLHKIWHDDAECVSSVQPTKNFKNPRWTTKRLRDLFCIITRYCNLSMFKMAAVCHLGILKFLTANDFRDTFYIITLNFVEISGTVAEISHFSCFIQVKRKSSLDDHT